MPLYDVTCVSCGHTFEVFKKYGSPEETVCEKCGAPTERKVSSSNFHLSGSGWAKDNYGG